MRIKYEGSYADRDLSIFAEVNEVNKCPICKTAIKPHVLSVFLTEANERFYLDLHILCKACDKSFLAGYKVFQLPNTVSGFKGEDVEYFAPNKFSEEEFEDRIKNLSSQFVKIYNQSKNAETLGLDEIAGLGYRKALEFLVKDFAIFENQADDENIKKMPLGQCIDTYMTEKQIKTLTKKAAWIGNDEAHYIKKIDNKDINDMKIFIQATLYFISMTLIVTEAEKI